MEQRSVRGRDVDLEHERVGCSAEYGVERGGRLGNPVDDLDRHLDDDRALGLDHRGELDGAEAVVERGEEF